jgi:high-affinity iron transporter
VKPAIRQPSISVPFIGLTFDLTLLSGPVEHIIMASHLFDFAMITIFAREFLEGSIIIGEYRTVVLRGNDDALAPDVSKQDALSEITIASVGATALALLVIACIAIPLAVLSSTFDPNTGYIIEGVSKIVAAISLLLLSLKLPHMLGIYASKRSTNLDGSEDTVSPTPLTLRSIRLNVAWNIWREVFEIGAFLLPSFLAHDDLQKLPLSALVGAVVGLFCGIGVYVANQRLINRSHLCLFVVLLVVVLSGGLFTGGLHKFEIVLGSTEVVWTATDKLWDDNRLPMTILKPFGYSDSRTLLEILSYWTWLTMSAALHGRKFAVSPRVANRPIAQEESDLDEEKGDDFGIRTVDQTVESNDSDSPSSDA